MDSELCVPRFKAVIVDHDDCAVDSSRHIHHPAHLEIMKILRPLVTPCDLGGWFSINSSSTGLRHYLVHELRFTNDELLQEYEVWRTFTTDAPIPPFYPGFIDLLVRLKKHGCAVIVCSHSEETQITRHYASTGFTPDAIYGWSHDKAKTKPNSYPIDDTIRVLGLSSPSEICVVDDMSPGIVMAQKTGAYPVAAAWGPSFNLSKDVHDFMVANVPTICESIPALSQFLFTTPTK